MPKIIPSVALRGDIPEDAEPVGVVARQVGISRPALIAMLGKTVPGWLYMGRYYYCRLADVLAELQGRKIEELPSEE